MDWLQALVLALVQGITEFLPISSSGHLIIASQWLGWEDQGLLFDLGVHAGTLIAVVVFFRTRIMELIIAFFAMLRGKAHHARGECLGLLVASVPAAAFGVLFVDLVALYGRSLWVIVCANTVFALVLGWSDKRSAALDTSLRKQDIGFRDALLIGCAQVLAFIPGTSRSGVTLSCALLLGYARKNAARFCFLLSIPIIGGGSALTVLDLVSLESEIQWSVIGVAMLVSAVTAGICIKLFLALIDTFSLLVFVIYRLLLSCLLLVYLL